MSSLRPSRRLVDARLVLVLAAVWIAAVLAWDENLDVDSDTGTRPTEQEDDRVTRLEETDHR